MTPNTISGTYENLVYNKWDDTYGAMFDIQKKIGGATYKFAFDLRYYEADLGGDKFDGSDNCPSGAYIFKPAKDKQSSIRYAKLDSVQSYNSPVVSEFHLTFSESQGQQACVRVRVGKQYPVSSWEVILSSIPDDQKGMEVTVNWKSFDIDNNEIFYTDSNALEMQQRKLNSRPTWTLSTDEPISANYYPINSAIAIEDTVKNLQMTVMNDRSQGGSVIEEGRIELMHHRRLFHDDWRGVDEPLNERDSLNKGIVTPATYHLQIFDQTAEQSYQRVV